MKRILALFLALCCCFSLAACGGKNDDSVSNGTGATDSTTETSDSVVDSTGTTEETLEALNVPVYNEHNLLIDINTSLELGDDACKYKGLSGMARTLFSRLRSHPTEAVREREDGFTYIVYDTDTGYRVYRFYGADEAAGFVIVINKENVLSYDDFKDIKIGDSILAVEAIDSVATLHKKKLGVMEPNLVEALARNGFPWTTVHYLTDGILKINYTSPEKGTFLVSEIIFDENYNITGQDGKIVNHKIENIDLPIAWGNQSDTSADTQTVAIPWYPRRVTEDSKEYFGDVIERVGASWDAEISMDIPVYYEDDILFPPGNPNQIGEDSSYYFISTAKVDNDIDYYFARYPTNALRVREDGTSYLVYDTHTGYRVYWFVNQKDYKCMGFPVVINKNEMLSYNHFQGLQIGDTIEKVAQIDTVATLYQRKYEGNYSGKHISYYYSSKVFDNRAKSGNPFCSIHYLTDGILLIEYLKPDETNITISDITFYEDFIVQTVDGRMTSHKIKDIDLPVT